MKVFIILLSYQIQTEIRITKFLWPELMNIDLEDIWFQQDGTRPHFANETITLLRTKFLGCVISRNCDVNWPPRSCDLSLMDYFL